MSAGFEVIVVEECVDECGVRLVILHLRKRVGDGHAMVVTGLELLAEAAAAVYAKSNKLPGCLLLTSVMGTVSIIGFVTHARRLILESSNLNKERLRLFICLSAGVILFTSSCKAFCKALKTNSKNYIVVYLGVAAWAYFFTVSSITKLEQTVRNKSPFLKSYQLLFGPTLLSCAAFYLKFQTEEIWFCIFILASGVAGNHISHVAYGKILSGEAERSLHMVLEVIVGGSILCLNTFLLLAFSMNKFSLLLCPVYVMSSFLIYADLKISLEIFQECVEIRAPVLDCICGMIGGPIIFVSGCCVMKCIRQLVFLPLFLSMVGIGIRLLVKSAMDLRTLVPEPQFKTYCQRTLGPVSTVCSALATIYIAYNVGWRSSLVVLPLISAGIWTTYQGFKNEERTSVQ